VIKKMTYAVVHEDDDIIVIDKAAGMLSLPDRFDDSLPNVRTMLTEKMGHAFIVHRLDKYTSGIMVVGKTAESHRNLSEQFGSHSVQKLYHAIVGGIIDKPEFPIDIPMAPDPKRKGLMKPTARGKEAHTVVKVLQKFRVATLLECRLITGRQHQIRVHCAAIGHPLLVDADYGKSTQFLLSSIKRRYNLAKNSEEKPIIERQTLHARTLSFIHPGTLQKVSYEAPYPKDFTATLQVLSKYSAPYTSVFDAEFFD